MNYYNRYPGDYARKTQDLSLVEHGAYTLLLDHLYGTQQVLPKNPLGLFRVTRAFTKEEQEAVLCVIKRFFIETEEGYTNTRFEEERTKAKARIDAARENGKKGGRKQNKTQKEPSGLGLGSVPLSQTEPSGSAYHQPSTISHQLETKDQLQEKKQTQAKPADCLPSRFEEFWQAYPPTERRVAKKQCSEKWRKSNLDAEADLIIAHVDAMKRTEQWRNGYEPMPLTYINQRRWEGYTKGMHIVERQQGQNKNTAQTIHDNNMAAVERARQMLFGGSDENR